MTNIEYYGIVMYINNHVQFHGYFVDIVLLIFLLATMFDYQTIWLPGVSSHMNNFESFLFDLSHPE